MQDEKQMVYAMKLLTEHYTICRRKVQAQLQFLFLCLKPLYSSTGERAGEKDSSNDNFTGMQFICCTLLLPNSCVIVLAQKYFVTLCE